MYEFKQEEPVAQQNTPLSLSIPEQLQINLLISFDKTPTQTKKQLLSGQSQQSLIKQESMKNSKLKQQCKYEKIDKNEEKKRKSSQKSDHYHRVHNSRKIKTKKVTKDQLQRSQYFYYDNVNEVGSSGQIMNLLNQYEAFHQMLFDRQFEKKVIKLSHYGKKNNHKKHSNPQLLSLNDKNMTNSFENSIKLKYSDPNIKRVFSKSLVEKHSAKMFFQSGLSENKKDSRQMLKQKQAQMMRNDTKINKKSMNETNLSKYTTPIRTIYLKAAQYSPQNQSKPTNASPNNQLSTFTPLISERIRKKQIIKPFKSIMQNSLGNPLNKQIKLYSKLNDQLDKKIQQKVSIHSKLGLSIVSCKKHSDGKTQRNTHSFNVQHKQVNLNNFQFDDMILAKQISLPHYSYRQKSNHTFSQLHKFNNTFVSHQSQSRSRSKKGLSLTQSNISLKTNTELSKNGSKSITKIVHKKQNKGNNILEKKLDFGLGCVIGPKKVEIKIY